MEQAFIPAGLEQLLQIATLVFVVARTNFANLPRSGTSKS